MRVQGLINCRAGTVLGSDQRALRGIVEGAFVAAGHDICVACIDPRELESWVRQAVGSEPDAVLVAGGDGTVRCAAHALAGTHTALGIIPLGTINRLARDLAIPLDCERAAHALARPTVRRIDVADVNGRSFLCNSLLGLPLDLTESRQLLRGRPLLERMAGYARTIARVLGSTRRLRLSIDDGEDEITVRAISLAIVNNAYCEAPSLLLRREALDRGELAVYVLRHKSGWAVALAVLRAMLGIWRSDPALEQIKAHRITIRSRRRQLRLSNDGEVEVLATPLVYQIRPKALKVLVPAHA